MLLCFVSERVSEDYHVHVHVYTLQARMCTQTCAVHAYMYAHAVEEKNMCIPEVIVEMSPSLMM